MGKALKRVFKIMRESDVVLELVDARFPRFSKRIEKSLKRRGVKLIIVFNKSDLIKDDKDLQIMANDYNGIIFSAKTHRGKRKLIGRLESYAKKLQKEIKVGVVGVPNVGKSKIINTLVGRKSARTSAKAGYTKGSQWVRLSPNILLVDSPGVITWSEPEEDLVLRNSLDVDRAKDPVFIALQLFNEQPHVVKVLGLTSDNEEALEEFAKKTGKLKRGGEPNIKEAARMIIRKWQKGELEETN